MQSVKIKKITSSPLSWAGDKERITTLSLVLVFGVSAGAITAFTGSIFLGLAIGLTCAYLFYNGANDAPNSIAPIIATRTLARSWAKIFAGLLNCLGPFATVAVAKTIAKGIVPQDFVSQSMVLGALMGAVAWAAFATWRGIPVSITHSIVGGMVGAGIALGGLGALNWHTLYFKVILAIALAPIAGFAFAFVGLKLLKFLSRPIRRMSKYKANFFIWRPLQFVSAGWLSFSHGMNDAQNGIGLLALTLFVSGFSTSIEIHWWMILLSGAMVGLGTMIAGDRVINKVGLEITDLDPIDGFDANASAAAVNTVASFLGIPSSTTHASVSAVAGAGGAKSMHNINRKTMREIVTAWVLTIPAAGLVGALMALLTSLIPIFS